MASGHRVPHQQAAHMAAPTEGQNIKIPLPTESRPHMAQRGRGQDDRFLTQSGLSVRETNSEIPAVGQMLSQWPSLRSENWGVSFYLLK
jgi:hypothetical protein